MNYMYFSFYGEIQQKQAFLLTAALKYKVMKQKS